MKENKKLWTDSETQWITTYYHYSRERTSTKTSGGHKQIVFQTACLWLISSRKYKNRVVESELSGTCERLPELRDGSRHTHIRGKTIPRRISKSKGPEAATSSTSVKNREGTSVMGAEGRESRHTSGSKITENLPGHIRKFGLDSGMMLILETGLSRDGTGYQDKN